MYHLWASLLLLCATVVHAEEYYVSQHPAKVVPNKIYAFAMPEAGTLDGFLRGRKHAKRGELVGQYRNFQFSRITHNPKRLSKIPPMIASVILLTRSRNQSKIVRYFRTDSENIIYSTSIKIT